MHEPLATVLAGFLVVAGTAHFLLPSRVQELVPEWWPWPRLTVHLSGVVEVLLGLGLLLETTQREAAYLLTGLFVAYAGVHLDDVRHSRGATRFGDRLAGVVLRTVVNLGYAAWALCIATGTVDHG